MLTTEEIEQIQDGFARAAKSLREGATMPKTKTIEAHHIRQALRDVGEVFNSVEDDNDGAQDNITDCLQAFAVLVERGDRILSVTKTVANLLYSLPQDERQQVLDATRTLLNRR